MADAVPSLLPPQMQAMILTGHGDMDKLEWHEAWPVPTPKLGEVLVEVGACGLNNTDINTRTGWYSKAVTAATTGGTYETINEDDPSWGGKALSFPRIQGADIVGRVVAIGDGADRGLLGRRVMVDGWLRDWADLANRNKAGYIGSECDGGFAQYVALDARNVLPVESGMTDAELATFPCSWSTAEGMLSRIDVTADDFVLITGASGGVGSALIQLTRRRGACVVAMASEDKHSQLAAFEPDALLPRAVEDLGDALEQAIGRRKVSVVADVVGGPAFGSLIETLEPRGRYVTSGAIAGPMVNFDLRTLYLNDLTFAGSTVLPPQIAKNLVSYIEKGEVKPMLAATYPLRDLKKAQEAFIAKGHVGNIVVTP